MLHASLNSVGPLECPSPLFKKLLTTGKKELTHSPSYPIAHEPDFQV